MVKWVQKGVEFLQKWVQKGARFMKKVGAKRCEIIKKAFILKDKCAILIVVMIIYEKKNI